MNAALLVFLGGGLGALGRWGLSLVLPRSVEAFPWATLLTNVLGALLIGLLVGKGIGHEGLRLLLLVGALGGFTTFSAFSLEAIQLLQHRGAGLALVYVGASLGLGILACWAALHVSGHA